MNILYFWAENDSFMSQWQRVHIFNELEHKGHKIAVFNPLNYESFELANEKLISYLKTTKIRPALFMTCLNSEQIYKETILEIKQMGFPTLLVCFDNLHVPYNHKAIASLFDLIWLTSMETKYLFDKWGAQSIFLPYAANPFVFKRNPKKEINSIGFIGTPYGTRIDKINLLTNNRIKCSIYTNRIKVSENKALKLNVNTQHLKSFVDLSKFPIGRKVLLGAFMKKIYYKESQLNENDYLEILPSVSFSEMNDLYSNLSLSLGISELSNTYTLRRPVHKLHLRTFEIPMCGGLQITSYTDELASYFEDEKEILLYNSDEELFSKAEFYLKPKNESLRNKMKVAARQRALIDHTWSNRFGKIFYKLNI